MSNLRSGIGFLLVLVLQTAPACVWAGGGLKAMAKRFSQQAAKMGIQRVAVLPFSPLDGSSRARGQFLSEQLAAHIARGGKVDVVERTMIKEIMDEHSLAQTGLLGDKPLARTGRMLQAQAVVVGSFVPMGDRVEINARLVDIESGAILAAGEASVEGDRALASASQGTGVGDLRDAPTEERCDDAAARIDALEESVLSLKARYWGRQLSMKKVPIEHVKADGALISSPELRGRYLDLLRLAAIQPEALSPMEVARFVNADGHAFILHRKCKVDDAPSITRAVLR